VGLFSCEQFCRKDDVDLELVVRASKLKVGNIRKQMRERRVPLTLMCAMRNNENFDSLTICVLIGAMSVLVDSV
jgi:hypothetical protein